MPERGKRERNQVELAVMEHLVPREHLHRKIDTAMDLDRLYEMVEPRYCEETGRSSINPVVRIKEGPDPASVQEVTPYFFTVSCNFRHRFTEKTVNWGLHGF